MKPPWAKPEPALKKQIKDNKKALDAGVEFIGKNIDLVRAAGLAFLKLSDQVTNEKDAVKVADSLRTEIQQNAPAALAQAENLEPIIVAALALDPAKLGLVSTKQSSN